VDKFLPLNFNDKLVILLQIFIIFFDPEIISILHLLFYWLIVLTIINNFYECGNKFLLLFYNLNLYPMKTKVFITILLLLPDYISGYNLRQYSSKDGLSNSAILSICQDRDGLMWFGSCEGLNVFDGLNFQLYGSTNKENNLSGNIIEIVLEAEDHILWVQTNYGLDRLDKYHKTVQSFEQFKGKNWLVKSLSNDIFVVNSDNLIYHYLPDEKKFQSISVKDLTSDDILQVAIDKENTLWIFMKGGRYLSYSIKFNSDGYIDLIPRNFFDNKETLLYCFYDENTFYFVDETYALYEYDPISKNKYYIYNLSAEIKQYGNISAIIRHKDDYFIGFGSSGLIVLQHSPELRNRFSTHVLSIKAGIICIKKDKFQDVIWIGSDGQGVYMYYNDAYTLRTTLFRDLPYSLNNPIRALYIDKYNSLWFGTKGDGIVKIDNYNIATNKGKMSAQFLSSNSKLKHNTVYTLVPSKKNILWIGNQRGLNYYSYKSKQIKDINLSVKNKQVRYVHSICEFNDSTLWIATAGEGIIKARLGWSGEVPLIVEDTTFIFDNGIVPSNYFFTSYKENDSIMWFGNRGYGAYRINNNTNEIKIYRPSNYADNKLIDDIFSIFKTNDSYWFGTSHGLVRMHEDGDKQVFEKSAFLPRQAIHCILIDDYNSLWLSTNRGLVKYNISENTYQTYWKQNVLEVTEFSDGAYFKHDPSGVLFFGGINGFVSVTVSGLAIKEHNPDIQFNHLSIFGKEHNINDFISTEKKQKTISLNHNQNFFSISFTAIDYINGNDYTYLYKLAELSDIWIDNGVSNTASFTNISPGKYTLLVKYKNNITGKESSAQSIIINILPPWYQTATAYVIYIIITLCICYFFIRLSRKWYRLKKENIIEKLKRRQREDIYESKLRFFTNITHEFCTPLTLIYGPCDRILSYERSDNYINKHASLIYNNAEKLNNLISELIEFRRLETGHKKVGIQKISISDLARKTAESFTVLANSKEIDYQMNIAESIEWNSDANCLNTIITNLLSNAFKYTSDKGKVNMRIFVEEEKLHILISNTGKGIKKEDLTKIFDRYTILDNFEDEKKNHGISRNGLGLAICDNLVKLLKGKITVSSELNKLTVFSVILPELEATESISKPSIDNLSKNILDADFKPDIILTDYDKDKKTIMIIDDDPSMLWFITDIFMNKYNVIPIDDPNEVVPRLKQNLPDLIISDIMMPDIDGIRLASLIKADKLLSHIPLILLSAKNTIEDQVKGIESGAEIYITKPFNIKYLEKMVERLIKRKDDLKQYFTSALSSFEINEGKLMHVEDKKFMEMIYKVIEDNISNPDFTVYTISSSLGYSTRQFYRRLKEITPKKANDIIKDYKLDIVKKLLITTDMTVDEIMYETGFHNRGNFFRIFLQRFGTTPKKYREDAHRNVTGSDLENTHD